MITVKCISNKGYLNELIVGDVYVFDSNFTAKNYNGTVKYGNLYTVDEIEEIIYKGIYPYHLFTIVQ